MVVEILTEAGKSAPEHLEPSPADAKKESVQIPISEAKLLKAIRIEPSEEERVRALLKLARDEAAAARRDTPSESSVIRRAISLGLDELERQRSRR